MVKRRKSKVLPPPSGCPLNQCMRMLAGAWTAHVLWYLREDERCFTELQNDIGGISAKMLSNRLRKLEHNGIVERFSKPTSPPTVWYALTPAGRELCAAMSHVVEIAQRLGPEHKTPSSLGPAVHVAGNSGDSRTRSA